ncbi:cytochrome P450 [Aspergillus egyptiacus]|nr:cytochrome P450 [Aspergillus egyptiacus]
MITLTPTRRTRRPLTTLLILITLLTLLYQATIRLYNPNHDHQSDLDLLDDLDLPVRSSRRIMKLSMHYGERNPLYERALQSHRRHAQRWGYGMRVLRRPIADGYWNKPVYLLQVIAGELARNGYANGTGNGTGSGSEDGRVEWIMWIDADSILLNPSIPLEIFLPPASASPSASLDDIHLLATKDHKGLNTGIFFLRVHPWSVKLLIETIAYPSYHPEVDLDVQVDQAAMERVLNGSSSGLSENKLYIPRTWINTYEWAHAYEGERGNLLVHFPGLGELRWEHMRRWLDVVERQGEGAGEGAGEGGWEVDVAETGYLRETREFWERVETARGMIREYEGLKEKGSMSLLMSREVETAVGELRRTLYDRSDDGELLQRRIDEWRFLLLLFEMQLSLIMGNLPSVLVILGFVYFLKIAYTVAKNPLSALPGPKYTKWTSLVLKYHVVRGNRPRYVHALHEKYGPIVRVSPTEADISSIPAAREIHRIASPYLKSPWYRLLTRKDGENVFSTTDPDYHRRHRRLLSTPLSDAYLHREMEPLVRSRIGLAIARMGEEANSARGVADIYKWFFFMSTDIIGELSFGESFRMLEKGVKDQYLEDLETVAKIGGIRATFPVTMKIAAVLPLSIFAEVVESTDRILEYAVVSVERYKKGLVEGKGKEAKPTLFTKLYDASLKDEKTAAEECLTDREIRNDAQSFIVAGSDTTATTLTYLVWSVLQDEKVQKKLVAELEAGDDGGLSDATLRDLPYLNQVINEALRLYPVVPSALPRVVPDEGRTLAGHWLPGGATVTTQLYSLHRDAEVFEQPERLCGHPSSEDGAAARDGGLLPGVPHGAHLDGRGHERGGYGTLVRSTVLE